MTADAPTQVHAREAGFLGDVISVATRALRSVSRDPETVIPALIVPVFFFAVNIGALEDIVEQGSNIDFKAFQLPVAIIFAVTGVSRAVTLVLDIQSGYFDRLAMTPVRRSALLLGLMVSDVALVVALSVPVLIMGFAVGVRFESGIPGIAAFVAIAALWSLVYAGFPYAIALKTGNPATVNTSFVLFFPFIFLTPIFIPLDAMTDWMATIATYNPVTYLLEALRSLVIEGWDWPALARGLASVAGVGAVSLSLALWALRGRVTRR